MTYAVIMAGGQGTRFWPKSRRLHPKQFCTIVSQYSMLEDTLARIAPLIPRKHIMLVINTEHVPVIKKLKLSGIQQKNIIAEPCGRNTAPCLGLASLFLSEYNPSDDPVIVAMPADHSIQNEKKFCAVLNTAIHTAQHDACIVVLGVVPTYPETGFGYIESSNRSTKQSAVQTVRRFIEKPTLTVAKHYCASGRFYWNSGIFVFRASVMLAAIKQHLPMLAAGLSQIKKNIGTRKEQKTIAAVYRRLHSISIDYGIMEKFSPVKLVPLDCGWNDCGSWRVLGDLLTSDTAGNVKQGGAPVLFFDARNNVVHSEKQLVAVYGMSDIAVVSTPDALLVIPKSRCQEVKNIVDCLQQEALRKFT